MNTVFNGARFLISWAVLNVAAVAGSSIGVIAVLVGFMVVLSRLIDGMTPSVMFLRVTYIMLILLLGLVMGGIVGSLQKGVLKQNFSAEFTGWVRLSILGAAAGMLVGSLVAIALSEQIRVAIESLTVPDRKTAMLLLTVPVSVPVISISFAQMFVLFRYSAAAWLWVLAHAVSLLVISTLLSAAFTSFAAPLVALTFLVAAICSPGIITGVTMLFLMKVIRR